MKIKDSAGMERSSPLFFVSPQQINLLIPTGTASGVALITVTNGANTVATGTISITPVSPGIFTADSSGQGLAAALVLRAKADGSQVFEPILRFDPAANKFVAIPIDLGDPSDQVFLVMFGTGVRNNSGLANVKVKIGGGDSFVQFAGSQGPLGGLDQINALLSRSLIGAGEVDVVVTVDGRASNTVRINVR